MTIHCTNLDGNIRTSWLLMWLNYAYIFAQSGMHKMLTPTPVGVCSPV